MNHWLSPYTMEASATKPTATFWAAAGGAVLCGQTAAFGLNLNNEEEEEAATDDSEATSSRFEHQLPKEPLFEKPLTPSDVGKLNRLVIPKQHAEKYFPLNGAAEPGEKGLLLGFEDEVGKSWRFRYSYWNSSQSYVLTKGWSRFVKEKRLDAGDIVLFARHPKEAGRLFIGWRRRTTSGDGGVAQPPCGAVLYPSHPYNPTHQHLSSNSALHPTDFPHAEEHTRGRSGSSKRLRLFGVNLVEWEEDESESSSRKTNPYHGYMFHSTNT